MYLTEMFGPTLQGEGILAGTMATFIRTAGCTVGCRACDTKHSWPFGSHYKKPHPDRSVDDIVAEVEGYGVRHVVITGGEPMETEDQQQFTRLCSLLNQHRKHVTVELSGSVGADAAWLAQLLPLVQLWSFSPKVDSMQPVKRPLPEFIAEVVERAYHLGRGYQAQLKFVVDPDHWDRSADEIGKLLRELTALFCPKVPLLLQTLTKIKDTPTDIWARQNRLFSILAARHASYDWGTWAPVDARILPQLHVLMGVR